MCRAGTSVKLLLLLAAAAAAAGSTEGCEGLTRRLQTKQLSRVFADWVLVWAVSDYEQGSELLANLTSSRVSFQLLVPNSRTVVYEETNVFRDGVCASYFLNLRIPSEPEGHTLRVKSGTLLKHGLVHLITSGSVDFYETCPSCLLTVFQGPLGRFLLSYRREGLPWDVSQDALRKQAECLGFAHDKVFAPEAAAASVCQQCKGVNLRLPTKHLHKVFGDWVLAWGVSDHQGGQDLLPTVSSSHVELRLLRDRNTVVLNERNVYTDDSCSHYVIDLPLPSDLTDTEPHTLHMASATVEEDGAVKPYNDSAALDFYQTCPDCLLLVYKYNHGRFLLSYRREGLPWDASQDALRKQAECLGFAHDKVFASDAAAAVGYEAVPACKKCDGLNTRLPTKDLHKIFGDWVLVWSVSDHQEGRDLLQNVSSSHVELRLLREKNTVVFNERNVYTDRSCSNYIINLTLPTESPEAQQHTLLAASATVETHGTVKPYNDSAALDFYQTCPDCLLLVYKYNHGRFLLSYRREGLHSDAEQLTAALDGHRKQSECLGFRHHVAFSYDGAADFCHKKSSPAVKHLQS